MSTPFTPTSELTIVDETALDTGDMGFTGEQLERFDTKLLRRLAAEANTDEISGRSTRLEIVAYFKTQRSLGEYTNES